MNPNIVPLIIAIFLMAHGWVHMSLTYVPVPQPGAMRTPFMPAWWRDAVDPAWPIMRLGLPGAVVRRLGWALWVLVVGLYTLAGLALIFATGMTGLWQGLAVGGSVVSLILLGLYWHPWLPVGVLIDLAIIALVLFNAPFFQFQ